MMKTVLILAIFMMAISTCFSQSLDTKIKDIREKFATIKNNEKKYKKEKFTFDCGTIIYYFDGSNLREAFIERIIGEVATESSYYYWDNKLFFSYWIIPQGGGAEQSNVPNLEYRFYFSNDVPIRYMKNKDIIDISKADHNPNDVKATGNTIISLYKTKKFSSLCD